MNISTSKFTNLILTVIAVLLLALALRAPVGITTQVQAQEPMQIPRNEEAVAIRDQADAIRDVARSITTVAGAIDNLASGSRQIAQAIRSLDLDVTVNN